MRKTKYKSDIPETYLSEGKPVFKGLGTGLRTDEENRALVYPQAEGIIRKFGGAGELCRVFKTMYPDNPENQWNESSIFRWTYPKEAGGTGGYIPQTAMRIVVKAARYCGIVLTVEDLYPDLYLALK